MTMIETTDGFIFGGFPSALWDSSNSSKPDSTRKSFVFSVKNPKNIEMKHFMLPDDSCVIYCYSSYGPVTAVTRTAITTQTLVVHIEMTQPFKDSKSSLVSIISQ
jgi:hypothetical protein